jgi:DNA invertase Pin-like site-specific DNA recombinase
MLIGYARVSTTERNGGMGQRYRLHGGSLLRAF